MTAAAGGARPIRVLAAAEAAFGLACLAAPGALESAAGVTVDRVNAHRFVQVLGVRHLVQAALVAAHPTPGALRLGAAVEVFVGRRAAGAHR